MATRSRLAAVVVGLLALLGCSGSAPPGTASPTTSLSSSTAAAASADAARPGAPQPGTWSGLAGCVDPALRAYRCGVLRVPVDRSRPRGPSLELDVLVAGRADASRTMLMLTGGPGQPGPVFAPRVLPAFAGLGGDYRVVMLDQRGTGARALSCPQLQDERGGADLGIPSRAAVRECARLIGPDREHYATTDTVADLESLRRALGVDRWAVNGVSYGTYVGQRYAAVHPDRVSALVLDSVVPVEGVSATLADIYPEFTRVMRAVCASPGRRCAGDPPADLATVLARRPSYGPQLLNVVTAMSYADPTRLLDLPERLRSAAEGDLGPLDEAIRLSRGALAAPATQYSQGVQAATLCADSVFPWGGAQSPEQVRDRRADHAVQGLAPASLFPFNRETARSNGEMLLCEYWPRVTDKTVPASAQQVRVPTLILAGELDLGTPLVWARGAQQRIPGSRLIVVPGAGHSVQVGNRHPSVNAQVARFLLR